MIPVLRIPWVRENHGVFCGMGLPGRKPRQAEPPKGCLPDDWQMIEVARRMGLGHLFPETRDDYVEALYEEYRQFTLGTGKDLAPFETLKRHRGLRWPVVDGRETVRRYVEGEDPYVKPGEGIRFYKNKAEGGKAVVWLRPFEPAAEVPDAEYPLWLSTGRVLEHWHTGGMTRRVPQLRRAVPEAFCELNPDDARRLGIADGERIRLVSRRGRLELPCAFSARGRVPAGSVFAGFYDEGHLVTLLFAPPVISHEAHADTRCTDCHGLERNGGVPGIPHREQGDCRACHVYQGGVAVQSLLTAKKLRARYAGSPAIPHSVHMRENCRACHGSEPRPGASNPHPGRPNCRACHVAG